MDRIYLGYKSKQGLKPIALLTIERYDRNIPDLLYKNGTRIVVLINAGVDLRSPVFLERNPTWRVIDLPDDLQNGIGSDRVIRFGQYQVGTLSTTDGADRKGHIYVFGSGGLKIAEVPPNSFEIMKVSDRAFQIVYWDDPPSGSGHVSKRRVSYVWPMSAKDGHWQLKPSPLSAADRKDVKIVSGPYRKLSSTKLIEPPLRGRNSKDMTRFTWLLLKRAFRSFTAASIVSGKPANSLSWGRYRKTS